MPQKTVTRADLVEALARRVGLQRNEANRVLGSILDHIEASLVKGDMVKLSRFGNFAVRSKRQRVGRNPKTGEEVPITPRRVVTFRASQMLRDRVEQAEEKKKKKKA
ncbi:MAG: integration host factor subunit alpha [Caulobacterales bacterium]